VVTSNVVAIVVASVVGRVGRVNSVVVWALVVVVGQALGSETILPSEQTYLVFSFGRLEMIIESKRSMARKTANAKILLSIFIS
jgi:hypothetical protein